ncbi:MAG: single-stranded DNA-binding protein [Opitutales bacterium]
MASFNKVILLGNLTRDPETRVTANGLTICKLGLATSRVYLTREGERKEETTFVDIDAFGKQAEVLTKYLRKGQPLMVEGRLKLDQWETNEGQKRSKLGVILENFQFLGGGRDDDASGGKSGGYENSSPPRRAASSDASDSSSSSSADDSGDTLDEDVPF